MQLEALNGIVDNLQSLALQAVRSQRPTHAAQIVAFLAKVAHIVDQGCSDILTLLIELQSVREDGFSLGEIHELRRRTAQLLNKSHFDEAGETYNQLSTLKKIYLSEISQYDPCNGRELCELIDQSNGRIVMMIRGTMWTLIELLGKNKTSADLRSLQLSASREIPPLKDNLAELRKFTAHILGLSSERGLLEMLRSGQETGLAELALIGMIGNRSRHIQHARH